MTYAAVKPGLDWVVALVLLLVMVPVVGSVLLVLQLATRESPIFTQARIGYREKTFTLYKIKTMYSVKIFSKRTWVGSFCRILRQYSLDEIPQLWNVLRGEMSLIGPRPLLVEYLPLYNELQRKRHQVKPGITGWAQVHGRNSLRWAERFTLDIWYVDNFSLSLDMKILAQTVAHLMKPQGVRPEGLAEIEKFRGN